MLKIHRVKLENNRLYLMKKMKLSDEVFRKLINDKVMTEELELEIKGKPTNEQLGSFLDTISRRGPQAYVALLNVLWETEQHEVVYKLDPVAFEKKLRLINNKDAVEQLNVKPRADQTNLKKQINQVVNLRGEGSNNPPNEDNDDYPSLPAETSEMNLPSTICLQKSISGLQLNKAEQVETIIKKINISQNRNSGNFSFKSRVPFFGDSSRIFVMKSQTEFIDGFDYSYIENINKLISCKDEQNLLSCQLIIDKSDLDIYLNQISKEFKTLSCALMLLVAKTNGKNVEFEEFSMSFDKILKLILQSVDLSKTALVMLMTLYENGSTGGPRRNGNISSKEIENAIQSKNVTILVCKISKYDEKCCNWGLCSMLECLKCLADGGSELHTRDAIFSLLSKVGKLSVERNIISSFDIFPGKPDS